KDGYEDRLLSRTLEDSITVTSALIPWNTCGMTQSTILNVPTLTYLPYCFFNLISPIMTLIIAALGYKIKRIKYEKS
ncbi:MAG: Na+/H+ antiporter NhaC family protein, partial [Tannerellaceae bacterium]